MAIGNDDAGIQFVNGTEHFRPFSMASNAATDALMDIGSSSKRFKDLYLSGNVKVASGQGIDFSSAANSHSGATQSTLNDYEEGSWTPNFSVTNATITHDIQTGSYTKIGNFVHFHMLIGTDTISGSFSGSNVFITGLPFTAANSQSGAIGLSYSFASSVAGINWQIDTSGSTINLYLPNNSASYVTGAYLGTGTNDNRLWISGSYKTDE
jgi:hypothetical protein